VAVVVLHRDVGAQGVVGSDGFRLGQQPDAPREVWVGS
jgi:hypothetical protein